MQPKDIFRALSHEKFPLFAQVLNDNGLRSVTVSYAPNISAPEKNSHFTQSQIWAKCQRSWRFREHDIWMQRNGKERSVTNGERVVLYLRKVREINTQCARSADSKTAPATGETWSLTMKILTPLDSINVWWKYYTVKVQKSSLR